MRNKTVAIVGRPNVGKSSLFNRLVGYRKAIVFDQPGVTIDNNKAATKEHAFFCTDTAGFSRDSGLCLVSADLMIVLFDGKHGVHEDDHLLVDAVRRDGSKTIFAVNKIDRPKDQHLLWPFYQLGLPKVFAISALRCLGIDNLTAKIESVLQISNRPLHVDNSVRVTLVGKQNAGKSLLLNKIASTELATVSSIAGTTRDSIDWCYKFKSSSYTLTDTAGLRRKSRQTKDKVEFLSVTRTLRSVKDAQVVVVVIDITQGVVQQDLKIVAMSLAQYKPTLIVLNKWDLIDKSAHNVYDRICKQITSNTMPWASYLPIMVTSALTNYRVSNIKKQIEALCISFQKRVPTAQLNQAFAKITTKHLPPIRNGRKINFYYATQAETKPPTFVIKCNFPDALEPPYQRYLATKLRCELGFSNVPIKLLYRR